MKQDQITVKGAKKQIKKSNLLGESPDMMGQTNTMKNHSFTSTCRYDQHLVYYSCGWEHIQMVHQRYAKMVSVKENWKTGSKRIQLV